MTNFRHLGPINTSSTSGADLSQSIGSSQDTGSVESGSLSKELSSLEQARQQMRSGNDPIEQGVSASRNDEQGTAIQVSQLKDQYGESMRQVFEGHHNASTSTSNADRLKGEARNLKAAAAGRPAGIANQLKDQARQKEIQAIQEERNAQQALIRAQEAQREADSVLERLQDAISQFNDAYQRSVNLQNDLKNSQTRLSDTDSELDNLRANSSSSQPAGIEGGSTPQPVITPSQPAGIEGGFTPQPVIRPSQPPGIDPGGEASLVDSRINPDVTSPYLKSASQPAGINPAAADVASLDGGLVGGASADQGGFVGGNSYLQAARALLRAILMVTIQATDPNPIVQIAKNLTNKGLSEQAIAYLEAALVDSAIQGSATNQQIILTKAQANTVHGEAETNIGYWKEVLNQNKQLEKDTHDLAKSA